MLRWRKLLYMYSSEIWRSFVYYIQWYHVINPDHVYMAVQRMCIYGSSEKGSAFSLGQIWWHVARLNTRGAGRYWKHQVILSIYIIFKRIIFKRIISLKMGKYSRYLWFYNTNIHKVLLYWLVIYTKLTMSNGKNGACGMKYVLIPVVESS